MAKPCIICVAITGSVPTKADNPAVPITVTEQVESTHAAVTPMYFEGDPMIRHCPIVATLPDAGAVEALIAHYDPDHDRPMDARAFRFDIVLRGRWATPMEGA